MPYCEGWYIAGHWTATKVLPTQSTSGATHDLCPMCREDCQNDLGLLDEHNKPGRDSFGFTNADYEAGDQQYHSRKEN